MILPFYGLFAYDPSVLVDISDNGIVPEDVVVGLQAEPYPGAGEVECEIEGGLDCDMMILSEDRGISRNANRF